MLQDDQAVASSNVVPLSFCTSWKLENVRSTGFEELFIILDRILLHFEPGSGITIVSKMGNVLWVQICLVCCGSQVIVLLPLKLYFQWVCFCTMADILLTYFHWPICPINLQPSSLLKFTLLASTC